MQNQDALALEGQTRRKLLKLAVLGAALPTSALIGKYAHAAEFTYKLATGQDPTHPVNVRAQEAAKRILEATGGRLEIKVFPANQLGSDTDLLAQVRNGGVEFFNLAGSILATLVPAAGIANTGFAFTGYDQVWKAMDGNLGQYIRAQMEKVGILSVGRPWDNGFRQITTSSKQIKTPDDLHGLKMRVPVAPMLTSLFQALGAGPTPINFNELYSALQTKLVEGQENPLPIIATAKLYEVQKYVTMTSHVWDAYWILGNRAAMQRLPAPVQEIVRREFDRAALDERADIARLNGTLRADLTAKGLKFVDVDKNAFRDALRKAGFYQKWRDKFGPEAWAMLQQASGELDVSAAVSPAPPVIAGGRPWVDKLDTAIARLIEVPAALAVVAEVGILLTNVVARFLLHEPLVWGDELASIVFLWLAMFGSAVALRRGEHMRMTALVGKLPARARAHAETLATVVPVLFLAMLLSPGIDYAQNQWFVESPALGLHDTFRAAAVPAGCALMLLVCVPRLLRQRVGDIAVTVAFLALVAVALYLGRGALLGIGNWNLAIFFGLLLALGVLAGLPIAFCFGLATVAYLVTTTSTPLMVLTGRIDEGVSSLILLAIPLFILLGQLIVLTGMSQAMVNFLSSLLGHVRGGLQYVLIGAMILVSGISGAKTADMAAVAPVLFPEMKKRGADEGEFVSLLAACGAMAETIPPSLVLIIIGSVTGVSIAALFTGGLLPGVVLALGLALIARKRVRRDEGVAVRASARTILRRFAIALPVLALPVLIRAAVVGGIATATEVSTIGIAYTLVVGVLVYRKFDVKRVYPMLVETASLSGAILFIIGTATCMAWALTQASFSHALAAWMAGMPGGSWGFLLISIAVFVVLGSVLEGIPAMVLFGPLLFPVARQLGVHEVHYAMVVILSMGIGLFMPPFGLGYYSACAIARIDPDRGLRKIWPYMGALLVGLIIIAAVPWFSTGFIAS